MSSENFIINLIKVNECLGINFYSGSIRLEDLFANFDVPIYKSGKDVTAEDGGYQREAKHARVDAISHRIIDPNPGQVLPNTESFVDNINLNLRAEAAEEAYIKPIKGTGFGDIFTFKSFYLRTLAGIFLGSLYLFRGFGIVVYTHIIYDIVIISLPVIVI